MFYRAIVAPKEKQVRLTVYTDYALRMLMYLALRKDQLATIAEIADSYDISRNHLMKVAHQLGIAGYVETVRGRGGGLRLAQPGREHRPRRHRAPCRAGHGDRVVLRTGRGALRHPVLLRAEARPGQ